ncbi:MAG: hypothetical protein AAF492_33555, partial [Verrucomicrobiota bacterium]
ITFHEYAFDTDPLLPTLEAPALRLTHGIQLQVPINRLAYDLEYTIQSSATLNVWSNGSSFKPTEAEILHLPAAVPALTLPGYGILQTTIDPMPLPPTNISQRVFFRISVQ